LRLSAAPHKSQIRNFMNGQNNRCRRRNGHCTVNRPFKMPWCFSQAIAWSTLCAHRGLRLRQPPAAAFHFDENDLPIRSGKHQIGPAWHGAKPPQPVRGDRIAIFAERDMAKPPPGIEPAPDHVDQERLRGELGWRWRCRAALPARSEQVQLPPWAVVDRPPVHFDGTWHAQSQLFDASLPGLVSRSSGSLPGYLGTK
jgi:hypothetical protein